MWKLNIVHLVKDGLFQNNSNQNLFWFLMLLKSHRESQINMNYIVSNSAISTFGQGHFEIENYLWPFGHNLQNFVRSNLAETHLKLRLKMSISFKTNFFSPLGRYPTRVGNSDVSFQTCAMNYKHNLFPLIQVTTIYDSFVIFFQQNIEHWPPKLQYRVILRVQPYFTHIKKKLSPK